MKANIYFTSDQHLGHANIIKHCKRPYSSVGEMDYALIEGWNAAVGPKDVVYQLGDFTIRGKRQAQEYFSKLNGKIHVLPGDHDKRWMPKQLGESEYHSASDLSVVILPPIHILKIEMGKEKPLATVLCHYSLRTWPLRHYSSIHLYGHSHGRLPGEGMSMDVGVDAAGISPLSLADVLKRLKGPE